MCKKIIITSHVFLFLRNNEKINVFSPLNEILLFRSFIGNGYMYICNFSPLSIRWPCTKFRDLKCFRWLFEIIWYRQQNVKFLKFLLFFTLHSPPHHPFLFLHVYTFRNILGAWPSVFILIFISPLFWMVVP